MSTRKFVNACIWTRGAMVGSAFTICSYLVVSTVLLITGCDVSPRSHNDFEGQVMKEQRHPDRYFFEIRLKDGGYATFYSKHVVASAVDFKVDEGQWVTVCCPEAYQAGWYVKDARRIQKSQPREAVPAESIKGREF